MGVCGVGLGWLVFSLNIGIETNAVLEGKNDSGIFKYFSINGFSDLADKLCV